MYNIKLNQEQIKDLKWVKENIQEIEHQGGEDEPYLLIDGWKDGFLDYPISKLENDVEDAIATGESASAKALLLVISHFKKYDKEIGF